MSTPHPTPGAASLISAAPLLALAQDLRLDILRIKARTPHSPDLATLERFREDLDRALAAARNANVFLTVDEVAGTTGRPRSTVRRICEKRRERVGAKKVGGVWQIHWPTWDANSGDVQ